MNINKIMRLYKSGMPATKIAKLYSVKNHKIYSLLKDNGIKIRDKGGREKIYGDGWSNEFVKLYKQGMTINEISKKFNIGFSTVRRGLCSQKNKMRRNGNRKRTIKMPHSLYKLGYIAGLLDGEGNIGLKKRKIKNGKFSMQCKLSIYNTNSDVMKWLEKNIGGKIRWDFKRQKKEKWKPIGIWSLYRGADINYFLKKIKKYLIIKKDAADTLLAIYKKAYAR